MIDAMRGGETTDVTVTSGPQAPREAGAADGPSVAHAAHAGGEQVLVIAADATLRRFVADALAEYGYLTT
jgi:hypothetical protein